MPFELITCPACGGSGGGPDPATKCGRCDGKGELFRELVACPKCNGGRNWHAKGPDVASACDLCGATGDVSEQTASDWIDSNRG